MYKVFCINKNNTKDKSVRYLLHDDLYDALNTCDKMGFYVYRIKEIGFDQFKKEVNI